MWCAALALGGLVIASCVPPIARGLRAISTADALPDSPTVDPSPVPASTASPVVTPAIGPVEGGLCDRLLKSAVWGTILSFYSNVRDCTDVSNTAIEVIQSPKADGVWQEAWTAVACGKTTVLRIKFAPDSSGAARYDITE